MMVASFIRPGQDGHADLAPLFSEHFLLFGMSAGGFKVKPPLNLAQKNFLTRAEPMKGGK
jgi:hypothetical protein